MTRRPDRPSRPAVPANLRARLARLEALTKHTERSDTGARERLAHRIARMIAHVEENPDDTTAHQHLARVLGRLERITREKAS